MPTFTSLGTIQRLSPLTTLSGKSVGQLELRGLEMPEGLTPEGVKPRTLNLGLNLPSASNIQSNNSTGGSPATTIPNAGSTNYDTNTIQGVIDKYAGGKSPLTAQDYLKASQETGIPVDALLTQGALESQFQTTGAGAKTNNVGNVGNTDDGSTKTFASPYEGLLAQAKLLKEAYSDKQGNFTADLFIQNDFKGKYGRYATDPKYGEKYSSVLQTVRSQLGSAPIQSNEGGQPQQAQSSQSNTPGKIIDKTEWSDVISAPNGLLDMLGVPTKTGAVNSPFGYRPIPAGTKGFNISQTNGQQINVGTDFAAKPNEELMAVADGKVINAGPSELKGGGTSVTLEFVGPDGEKYYADYNHLSGVDVKKGQTIKKGEIVGKAGQSGNATGVHLDMAVYKKVNGRYQFIDTSGKYKG